MAASAAGSTYQQKRQSDRTKAQSQQQADALAKAEAQEEQEYNRQNQTSVDVSKLLEQNMNQSSGANLTGGNSGSSTLGGGGMLGR